MSEAHPRWLTSGQAAAYIGRRVDEMPRLLRAGKLPTPSYHFGPRSPRYDRFALDSLFTDTAPADSVDLDKIEQEAVNGIIERARRGKDAGRRNRKRIPIRQDQARG